MARRRAWWFGKLTQYWKWLARYGSATIHWSDVEASMAFHYNLTLHDIWTMSWRRFVVLFDALWPRKAQEDADTPSVNENGVQKFDVIKDWNALVGSQAEAGKPKELHQYMREQGMGG